MQKKKAYTKDTLCESLVTTSGLVLNALVQLFTKCLLWGCVQNKLMSDQTEGPTFILFFWMISLFMVIYFLFYFDSFLLSLALNRVSSLCDCLDCLCLFPLSCLHFTNHHLFINYPVFRLPACCMTVWARVSDVSSWVWPFNYCLILLVFAVFG